MQPLASRFVSPARPVHRHCEAFRALSVGDAPAKFACSPGTLRNLLAQCLPREPRSTGQEARAEDSGRSGTMATGSRGSPLSPVSRRQISRRGGLRPPGRRRALLRRSPTGPSQARDQTHRGSAWRALPPGCTQQNLVYAGRGLPEAELDVNTLPFVALTPIDENYVTPKGSFPVALELDGRKPREYTWSFSIQKSIGANWLAEAAYVGL